MKTVLLVVDMQNDFCLPSGLLYVPGAERRRGEVKSVDQGENDCY